MGVLVASELSLGEVVSLRFVLPESLQDWELNAVLRHRRGYHYGFEFLSISRDQITILRDCLAALQRAD